jgi:hypothetical protein
VVGVEGGGGDGGQTSGEDCGICPILITQSKQCFGIAFNELRNHLFRWASFYPVGHKPPVRQSPPVRALPEMCKGYTTYRAKQILARKVPLHEGSKKVLFREVEILVGLRHV